VTGSDWRDDLGRARVAVWCVAAFLIAVVLVAASAVTLAVTS
jgi:hypothetical protein